MNVPLHFDGQKQAQKLFLSKELFVSFKMKNHRELTMKTTNRRSKKIYLNFQEKKEF